MLCELIILCQQSGGGGVSASILLRGEGRVIRGGGAQKKNLQISDLQRLASLTACQIMF